MSGDPNGTGPDRHEPAPSSDGKRGRSLPPPAFPPGVRGWEPRRAGRDDDDLAAALILPDEPLPERGAGIPPDAFISPDLPIQHRAPRSVEMAREDLDPDDVVVTGIGDDAHLDPDELAVGFDPHVLEVVEKVGKLAEALKRKGEAGLRTTPEMSRFEATLRSYCVGYLAGRRAEDEEG